jgi:hypothetical protein
MGKETNLSPSGKPGPNPSQVLSLDSSFNPWDSSSLTQLLRDNDDYGDEDKEGRDDDYLIDVDNDNDLMRLQNFDLNNVDSMSDYELLRLWRIHRNKAKLASLGLLGGMTSTAFPSSDRLSRKKRAAPQDDVERRVQPKRNAKKTTSYRDLDNHVIYKRTQPIDSSDTGEEDTVRKRMREDGGR